jgi:peptide/nickel transport system ATP-binding protein
MTGTAGVEAPASGRPAPPGAVASVEDLRVSFNTPRGVVQALRSVTLEVQPGEVVALVGESGSGKSVLGMSLLGLVSRMRGAQVSGTVRVADVEMLTNPDSTRRLVRREALGAVFQDPLTSLDPTMKIGRQLTERGITRARALENLRAAGVPEPERRFDQYPHELSGGLRQRVSIAMAIGTTLPGGGVHTVTDARGVPRLIVADEPTTALDVSVQAQVVLLFDRLRREHGCAVLFVTHDLGVAASIADRIAVMYSGRLCELGAAADVLQRPSHPYTRALLEARVSIDTPRAQAIRGIAGSPPDPTAPPPGCPYAPRCPRAQEDCTVAPPDPRPSPDGVAGRIVACLHPLSPADAEGADVESDADAAADSTDIAHAADTADSTGSAPTPTASAPVALGERREEPALELHDVAKTFTLRGPLGKAARHVHAVSGVSLTVSAGGSLALVGESGCGKTTTLRMACGLMRPDSGEVHWGKDAGRPQLVFQDAGSSLTPWRTVGGMLAEQLARRGVERRQRRAGALELLEQVGLDARAADAKPRELSGGQRQRAAIARALASEPRLLICDEPVSALDASLAIRVLDLLAELRTRLGVALLVVTHDLGVAHRTADEVAVMYRGKVVEQGPTADIFTRPAHPYTQGLLAAIPTTQPGRLSPSLAGEPPSPVGDIVGCSFRGRCPFAQPFCAERAPALAAVGAEQLSACHFAEQVAAGTAAARSPDSPDVAVPESAALSS